MLIFLCLGEFYWNGALYSFLQIVTKSSILYCSYIFGRFPKNGENVQKWKTALGLEYIQNQITGNVCMDHFKESDFRRKNKTELKPNVIPHLSDRATCANAAYANAVEAEMAELVEVAEEIEASQADDATSNAFATYTPYTTIISNDDTRLTCENPSFTCIILIR